MVADKRCICKRYVIRILYVPYKGIGDQDLRHLTKKIKTDMTKAHLKGVDMYSSLTWYSIVPVWVLSILPTDSRKDIPMPGLRLSLVLTSTT